MFTSIAHLVACVASVSVVLSTGLKYFSLLERAKIGARAKKYKKRKTPRTGGKPYGNACYASYSFSTKQTPQYTVNLPLLENTCKDDFCKDAGSFSKDGHLPLSNLHTGFEDVFAFSAKMLPLWEGVSRWMREARLSQELLVNQHWCLNGVRVY